MSDANKGATLSLKVMVNKEKNKVLFAEADSHFVDILLSFWTLPLGRILKALEKHYGDDEVPTIGSLSSLYRSLANLDAAHFVTDGAKQTLLNPKSSFEDEYKRLKVDITDYQPAEYFYCSSYYHNRIRSVSIYYDSASTCLICHFISMKKEEAKKESEAAAAATAACSGGVLTICKASFIISDDLHIFPNETGLLRIMSILGITDAHKAEEIKVELGFDEMKNLLKASLTSPTPLSDVILNKTTLHAKIPLHMIETHENPKPEHFSSLKVVIQKSTGKFLYAQAKEDFVEFLFGFFNIPLGGVEHLLAGKPCVRVVGNLYRGISDLADEYFKTPDMKKRLMEPKLVHGCTSKNSILPLSEHPLPANYQKTNFSSSKFPKGQGKFIDGPTTYKITDDLTVTPFCAVSALSSLNSLNIRISDVEEMELQIGVKEALSILHASLVSTSALTDALLTHSSSKKPKKELQD